MKVVFHHVMQEVDGVERFELKYFHNLRIKAQKFELRFIFY